MTLRDRREHHLSRRQIETMIAVESIAIIGIDITTAGITTANESEVRRKKNTSPPAFLPMLHSVRASSMRSPTTKALRTGREFTASQSTHTRGPAPLMAAAAATATEGN
jgi:hypothetical protein